MFLCGATCRDFVGRVASGRHPHRRHGPPQDRPCKRRNRLRPRTEGTNNVVAHDGGSYPSQAPWISIENQKPLRKRLLFRRKNKNKKRLQVYFDEVRRQAGWRGQVVGEGLHEWAMTWLCPSFLLGGASDATAEDEDRLPHCSPRATTIKGRSAGLLLQIRVPRQRKKLDHVCELCVHFAACRSTWHAIYKKWWRWRRSWWSLSHLCLH